MTGQPGGEIDNEFVAIDHSNISDYKSTELLPQAPDIIQSIRSWLRPTPYDLPSSEYRKHLSSHMAGTTSWLTSTQEYSQWLQQPNHGLLWIQGRPGSGKSVIAAKLIRELTETHPGCPVLFFFFRQIIHANHEPQALLRDWLDQLLNHSPHLQAKLAEVSKRSRPIADVPASELWSDLRMGLASLPKRVFCVADALDEMDHGNDDFLTALGSLGLYCPEKVKVLLISRPVPKLETPLRGAPCVRIRLEESRVDADISTYVRQSLNTSSISRENWDKIMDAVPGRANGIFLYAKLAIEAILEPGADISAALSKLPTDLNALYTKLRREHASRSGVSKEVQDFLLHGVTHAKRPLRLLELAELVRICKPGAEVSNLAQAKDLVRTACGPLLEILPDETVSVIHHSFTEYLTGVTRVDLEENDYPILKPGPAHACFAMACLRYLASSCADSAGAWVAVAPSRSRRDVRHALLSDLLEQQSVFMEKKRLATEYPLFNYSMDSWTFHVRQSEAAAFDQEQINVSIAEFLSDASIRNAWLRVAWQGHSDYASEVTQLHIAAEAGLAAYTKELLGKVDVSQIDADADGKTAICWAALGGHTAIVEMLLAAGAKVDAPSSDALAQPLHYAAIGGHSAVTKQLLQAGVHPMTGKRRTDANWKCDKESAYGTHTPLFKACQSGHVEAVSAFLPFLSHEEMAFALHWAAKLGSGRIVERILQQSGADVNCKIFGMTPLSLACYSNGLEAVKVLLQAGADVHISSYCYTWPPFDPSFHEAPEDDTAAAPHTESCIHALCGSKMDSISREQSSTDFTMQQEVLTQLVNRGVDINAQNSRGDTPLHVAKASPRLTRLLLLAGANADAIDAEGSTPLHLAESADVISILVEEGQADINATQNDGQTPLMRMLKRYAGEDLTLTFLQHKPDCNVADKAGNNALHHNCSGSGLSYNILKALLELGADPNQPNKAGFTPLLVASRHPWIKDENLGILIDFGADVNAADAKGRTLLFHLLCGTGSRNIDEYINLTRDLIKRGASASCRDHSGRTLLHEAVALLKLDWLSSSAALESLTSFGVDPMAVDHSGNTLLHEFALRSENHGEFSEASCRPVYVKLLSLGLDLEQNNYQGRTILHLLCSADVSETALFRRPIEATALDYIISGTKNLDFADNDGITPLHMACTRAQGYAKRLLDAGADATCRTKEGLSSLHFAARYRMSNIVGLLVQHLTAQSLSIAAHTNDAGRGQMWLAEHINACSLPEHGSKRFSPLHFACQSGIVETVAILLDAGADTKMPDLLEACEAFAVEDAYWRHEQNQHRLALKLEDVNRSLSEKRSFTDAVMLPPWAEARMEEIIDMLIERGVDSYKRRNGTSFYGYKRYHWDNDYDGYANRCIQRALSHHTLPAESGTCEDMSLQFTHIMGKAVAETTDNTIRRLAQDERAVIKKGESNSNIFAKLLIGRQYPSVQLLYEMGTDFLAEPSEGKMSNMAVLAHHGFSLLLDKIGSAEAAARFSGGEWHKYGDASQPGLWKNTNKGLNNTGGIRSSFMPQINGSLPLLLRAVQRVQPNLEVVRVLIENLGVPLDELTEAQENVMGETSALLYAAKGVSWWHAHQAVPYLVQVGADLEITNHNGHTPLHVALGADGGGGVFGMQACVVLVEAGANVNATDMDAMTCLAHAVPNVSMIQLLLDNGAKITPIALLVAIDAGHVEAVLLLLARGADPNVPLDLNRKETSSMNKQKVSLWRRFFRPRLQLQNDASNPTTIYALYHAMNANVGSARKQLVEILLRHGADPMVKFAKPLPMTHRLLQPNDNHMDLWTPTIELPENHQECTLLHYIIQHNLPVEEFLRHPNFDVDQLDAGGQTLLLAACASHRGPDHLLQDGHDDRHDDGDGDQTTIFQRLIALGADIRATDNAGRNILHKLGGVTGSSCKQFSASLEEIMNCAPELMEQADIDEQTPLLAAAVLAASRGHTRLVEAMLAAGADASAVTWRGDTVLHILAPRLHDEKVAGTFTKLVRHYGLDMNSRNNRGETPAFHWCHVDDWAAKTKLMDSRAQKADDDAFDRVVVLLGDLGANFLARDNKGRTLLHAAAAARSTNFKRLLDLGIDPMMEDEAQQTAVDVVAAKDNKSVLKLFEKK